MSDFGSITKDVLDVFLVIRTDDTQDHCTSIEISTCCALHQLIIPPPPDCRAAHVGSWSPHPKCLHNFQPAGGASRTLHFTSEVFLHSVVRMTTLHWIRRRQWHNISSRNARYNMQYKPHAKSFRVMAKIFSHGMYLGTLSRAFSLTTNLVKHSVEPLAWPVLILSCIRYTSIFRALQVTQHCAERGRLLDRIWRSLNDLFEYVLREMTQTVTRY